MPTHPLDNPVMAALLGPQAHLAESHGRVLRYQPAVSRFVALPLEPGAEDWQDLATLLGPGGVAVTGGVPAVPPPDWDLLMDLDGVQLVADRVQAAPDPEAVALTPADVPEMLDLVARTRPGPFEPRTIEMGEYLGIRRDGALIAMAGQRFRAPGWTEISAVCTDAGYRGEGLGTRLTLAVAAAIVEAGATPFLHAAASNTGAIRLYEALGFALRRKASFVVARAPAP